MFMYFAKAFSSSTSNRQTTGRISSRSSAPSSAHVRYAMLNEDGSLGRQQMPWYSRVWAAITWVFFVVIIQCQKKVFGIEDTKESETEREERRSRVSIAHEALELVPEEGEEAHEEEEEKERDPDGQIEHDENFSRSKSDGSALEKKGKFSRATSLFSKVKGRVQERLETARATESPKDTTTRKESVTNEVRDRVQSASSSGGPSTSSSFQSLVSKGVSAGKALRDTIQNLNERGDRLEATSDATERLADSSQGYASTSAALLAKYKGKGGFFG